MQSPGKAAVKARGEAGRRRRDGEPGAGWRCLAALVTAGLAGAAMMSCGGGATGENGSGRTARSPGEGAVAGEGAGRGEGTGGGAGKPAEVASGGRWELAGRLRTFRRATSRGRSQHMNGDMEAEVLASEEASVYPTLGPLRRLPGGAVLVEAHYAAGSAAPEVYFAMVKRAPGFDPAGGDWEYLIVEPSGDVAQRGRLPLCARCHAEAPHDRLFGGPR